MYTRRWRSRSSIYNYILRPAQHPVKSSRCLCNYKEAANLHSNHLSSTKNVSAMFSIGSIGKFPKFYGGNFVKRSSVSAKFYCSKDDGCNESGGKHLPVKDASLDEVRLQNGNVKPKTLRHTAHAWLAEQDQKEWDANEQLLRDRQKMESPFLTRRERFRCDFLRRVIPWEKITVSWDTFPYYINKETKNLLVECATSHLNRKHFTSSFGARLNASSERILLHGVPGTELYRERIVKALAHDLQVPLLVLDDIVHTPHRLGKVCGLDAEEYDQDMESGSEYSSHSDVEEASNDEDGDDEKFNDSKEENNDEKTAFAVLNLLAPCMDEYAKKVSGELQCTIMPGASVYKATKSTQKSERTFRKGDRVKYVGSTVNSQVDNRILMGKIATLDGPTNAFTVFSCRSLATGQRGEVYEVNGDQVAVILDNVMNKAEEDENFVEQDNKPSVCWIDIQEIEYDTDIEAQDWYIAIEALSEVLPSLEPIIVYFADSSLQLSRAVPKSSREEFIQKVEEMFDQLSGRIVWIYGKNNVVSGPRQRRKLVVLSKAGRLGTLPGPLRQLAQSLKENMAQQKSDISKVFTNVLSADPPKEEVELREFHKQLEEDKKYVTSRTNLVQLHKVLEQNELSCLELSLVKTDGMVFTKQKARQMVGWARNHYLSSCSFPSINGDRLTIPRESLEIAISRMREREGVTTKPSQNLKDIAKDDYERSFVSAVVPPSEIGVKFEDIGALDDVKKTLHELVTLPMRRPELFSHGNLLRPCKGILLFGPPGTGKTLLAKALATEAGANFINITGSTLTSKWFGDAEKLTKALFSFASKLAPVIIFVDEVDSLLGSRGGSSEHEATRRMRNEFMATWDGLRSKDSQRIIVLGATNRPFDLDDAVIRRLPRRIYVDLPNAENRMKILRIFLKQETFDLGFRYEEVANATEGYSGSDLKNLCIAAAYRPVQELLEEEKKGGRNFGDHIKLRPLNLLDFIQAKLKVGASVAYDATSMNELRKWNEQYGEGGSRTQPPFGFGSQVN